MLRKLWILTGFIIIFCIMIIYQSIPTTNYHERLIDQNFYKALIAQKTLKFKPPLVPKSFMIEESDFCLRNPDLNIIAYVHTTISETEKRKLTRETWAKAGHLESKVKVGMVFMVGLAENGEEELILEEESKTHHDIVQGNYTDSYHTLSYKALASLMWVSSHCPKVPWTLHADDDVLIDLFLLTRFLKTLDREDSFLCYPWKGSRVRRKGRWLVPRDEFPQKVYPPYCSGAVWILATRLIGQLLNVTYSVPFLWVDDVYITGVLAKKAGIGHFKYLKEYITKDTISENDFGKKIAWIHIPDRSLWWQKILAYYGFI